MTEMSFTEASSHVKQMKRAFRGFEYLDGVLKAAAKGEAVIEVAATEIITLRAAADTLGKQVEGLKVETAALAATAREEKETAARQAGALWRASLEKQRGVVVDIESAEKTAAEAGEKAKAELRANIEALNAERAEAEGQLKALRTAVSSLQQKVGGLG